jgi:hypothetical protein
MISVLVSYVCNRISRVASKSHWLAERAAKDEVWHAVCKVRHFVNVVPTKTRIIDKIYEIYETYATTWISSYFMHFLRDDHEIHEMMPRSRTKIPNPFREFRGHKIHFVPRNSQNEIIYSHKFTYIWPKIKAAAKRGHNIIYYDVNNSKGLSHYSTCR